MAGLKANYTQSFYFSTETFKIGLAFKAINHAHDIGDTAENIPGLQKCLADKGQEDFVGITWGNGVGISSHQQTLKGEL